MAIGFAVIVATLAVIGHIGRNNVKATDLDAGACIKEPDGAFREAHKTSCNSPHYAEIMGWVDDVSITFTSTERSEAQTRCNAMFSTYAAGVGDSGYIVGYFAKQGSSDRRDVLCFVKSAVSESLTQPVRTTT